MRAKELGLVAGLVAVMTWAGAAAAGEIAEMTGAGGR